MILVLPQFLHRASETVTVAECLALFTSYQSESIFTRSPKVLARCRRVSPIDVRPFGVLRFVLPNRVGVPRQRTATGRPGEANPPLASRTLRARAPGRRRRQPRRGVVCGREDRGCGGGEKLGVCETPDLGGGRFKGRL